VTPTTLSGVRHLLRVLRVSALMQARSEHATSSVIAGVVQPAVFLSVTAMAGGGRVDTRTALGCGLAGLWGATVWRFGLLLRQERALGTLPGIIVRPAGLAAVLIGKCSAAVVRTILLIAVTVGVFTAATGAPIRIAAPAPFAAALALAIVSAAAFGLLLSSLFVATRSALRIAEALTYPVLILGGLIVPVGQLPVWARPPAALISLHWAADLLTDAANGRSGPPGQWSALAATTLGYAVAAGFALRAVLHKARAEGTLELV
jgi:ABC-2 type transport system permease protein